jgi:hypothetical protein
MLNEWYYVAFMGDSSGLYAKFERKGFNHCFVFYPLNDNQYAVLEHGKMYVQFGTVTLEQIEEHVGDGRIIKVKSKRRPRAKWWWWIPTPDTCVTIVKQVLGIHAPFVWSPYQLYKYIKRKHKWEAQKEQ